MARNEPTVKRGHALKVNVERLTRRLEALNEFGAEPGRPGINRMSFSDADFAARNWLKREFESTGLATRMDAVGNVIGRWEHAAGPAVMLGSHLDSVPEGGRLDGALGVCAAFECVQTAMENGIEPACPIEIVATSEEEGRFGGMLGAQAMAGVVDEAWFEAAADENGIPLREAMRGAGLDPDRWRDARRAPDEIRAFLELHIEQGPVLDRAGKTVGIVEGISGVFNWAVTLTGEANHAGTTPMELRRDSFRGLAEFSSDIDRIIEKTGTAASRVTVGQVEIFPNYAHTVPGRTEFTVIGRDMDETVMHALADACRSALENSARRHGLDLEIKQASWLSPMPCHPGIIDVFSRQAEKLGLDAILLPSGAGHDTQVMTRLTRAGMIFVPSTAGISHAPDEHTDWNDIEAGCNLLLHAMLELAGVDERKA